jgi:hypothetical protein
MMEASPKAPEIPVFETTWLEGIVGFHGRAMPDGSRILTYILGNGHRYVISLNGSVLALTQKAVSPVIVAQSGQDRNDHHGA